MLDISLQHLKSIHFPIQNWFVFLLLFHSFTGRTEKSAPIKEPGRKEQPDSSKGEGSSVKRVHFEDKEMERKSENSESSDEDLESAKVVRVPSFFISKPLVDFDAGIGRVIITIIFTYY